jgi:DNA-binding XRE family transcriptional regulator
MQDDRAADEEPQVHGQEVPALQALETAHLLGHARTVATTDREEYDMKITMKAARVMAGIGADRAADHVGYKRGSLWRWESGRSRMPAIVKTLLCDFYGVDENDVADTGTRNDRRGTE